tara:strand:+ start:39875 stop:40807 length:933 start_codon:yes stop_codon:yes gene_type:complete
MNLKIRLIGFVLLGFLSCKKKDLVPTFKEEIQNYLVEYEELESVSLIPNVKLIDFRNPKLYNKHHISGSINIWRSDIEDSSYPYGGMMASQEQLEKLLSSKGIKSNDLLIVYDDNGLCDAARFWWVLQNYNYTNVRLLNTTYSEWIATTGSFLKEVPKINPTDFKFTNKPSQKLYISKEDVLQELNKNTVILDTRTPDEYSGKRQKKGAVKGGRIPNSKLIDWSTAINFHGNKKLKSIQELDSIYGAIIPSKETPIIVYCHSGVRSAHTTFVLTQLLGYKNVKNYDGSWTEWSYFDNLPFEKDSINSIEQ